MKPDIILNIDKSAITDDEKTTVAYGRVTLEGCISFPVYLKKYTDKETGERKMFVAYPQRKVENGYRSVVYPYDADARKQIEDIVLAEYERQVHPQRPEIVPVEVRVTPLPMDFSQRQVKTLGLATVKAAGITIDGVKIKAWERGRFVEMPQYKASDGSYKDIVYATDKAMRDQIAGAVLEAYDEQFVQRESAQVSEEPSAYGSLLKSNEPRKQERYGKKNAFHNFHERDYNYDKLEKYLLETSPEGQQNSAVTGMPREEAAEQQGVSMGTQDIQPFIVAEKYKKYQRGPTSLRAPRK